MIALLLLAAAPPTTAVEAERAFAADAQALGQWTAFRKWAAPDAVMAVPKPVNAQTWLRDRRDPPASVRWQPTASFVSCDGRAAVNTGAAQWPDGRHGYFTTFWSDHWQRGWQWHFDHGDDLTVARKVPAEPVVRRAACGRHTVPRPALAYETGGGVSFLAAPDDSLRLRMIVRASGAREVTVELWNGRAFEPVIVDRVAAPTP